MNRLFRFELRKLFRMKSFYICAAATVAMAVMTVIVMKLLYVFDEPLGYSVELPSIKGTLAEIFSTSSFLTICGVFIALFACADYEQGTIKNIYARGFSRDKVYYAKFCVAIFATLIMAVILLGVTALASWIAGFPASSGTGLLSSMVGMGGGEEQSLCALLGAQIMVAIARMALVFMLALAVKKVGVAIAGAVVGSGAIAIVFMLVDAIIDKEDVQVSAFWLDQMLADAALFGADGARLAIIAILALCYAVVFCVVGAFFNSRHEA